MELCAKIRAAAASTLSGAWTLVMNVYKGDSRAPRKDHPRTKITGDFKSISSTTLAYLSSKYFKGTLQKAQSDELKLANLTINYNTYKCVDLEMRCQRIYRY
jgi:hypothetical protein